MLAMVAATAALTGMHASIRHVSAGMHPFEIAFFRNLFGLVTVLPLVLRGGVSGMRSRQPWLHVVRALTGIGAMLSWFYALSVIPIAEATALSFTASIFGSVFAVLILRERMGARRWSAVGAGLLGTVVVLRPGLEAISAGALLVLLSSVCWGLSLVLVKRLSRTDSVVSIVTWNSIAMTALSLPVALAVWATPTLEQLAWLLLVGGLATAGHLAMTTAFKIAEATAVFPVDFVRLIWASALGYVLFDEVPDAGTWLGGIVIFGSTTYIALREEQIRRRGVGSDNRTPTGGSAAV